MAINSLFSSLGGVLWWSDPIHLLFWESVRWPLRREGMLKPITQSLPLLFDKTKLVVMAMAIYHIPLFVFSGKSDHSSLTPSPLSEEERGGHSDHSLRNLSIQALPLHCIALLELSEEGLRPWSERRAGHGPKPISPLV